MQIIRDFLTWLSQPQHKHVTYFCTRHRKLGYFGIEKIFYFIKGQFSFMRQDRTYSLIELAPLLGTSNNIILDEFDTNFLDADSGFQSLRKEKLSWTTSPSLIHWVKFCKPILSRHFTRRRVSWTLGTIHDSLSVCLGLRQAYMHIVSRQQTTENEGSINEI